MGMDNLIKSVSYFDFLNKITQIFNELLYSSNNGYFNLKSKNAICEYKQIISKFNYEISKISQQYDIVNKNLIISNKKNEFIEIIHEHYKKQVYVWVDEVFDILIQNYLFELSLDKNKAQVIADNIKNAVCWYSDVKKLNNEESNFLLESKINDFNEILNSKDNDYIPVLTFNTDKEKFIEIWELILFDIDEFLSLDFLEFKNLFIESDINLFQYLKNQIISNKKNLIFDEACMISTAIESINISDIEKKYDFIKQIYDDFQHFQMQNKQINDEQRAELIRRRINLFCDKNLKNKKYFTNLIFCQKS